MAKHIDCVVPGCKFQADAPTEQELLGKVAAHAKADHGLTEISPDLLAKVKGAIQDK